MRKVETLVLPQLGEKEAVYAQFIGKIVSKFSKLNSDAIIDKKIAGMGCDVFSYEPIDCNHPFEKILGYDNVLLTPHMAWGSFESRTRCFNTVLSNIDAYLNPRTRRVWNGSAWVDKPTTWNKLLKLPLEHSDVMKMTRYDLEDVFDVNEINIDLDGLWSITDNYGEGFQVCRAGEPWKQWKRGGLQNETEVKKFNTLQDAYNFYLERSDNKDIEKKLQGE